jgi:hypothetical protein
MVKNKGFEKVRSRLEREKLLESTISAANRLIVKTEGEALGMFSAVRLDSSNQIVGKLKILEGEFKSIEKVVCNLRMPSHRYFFQSDIVIDSNGAILRVPEDMFLLQRRAFRRFEISQFAGRVSYVVKHRGAPVYLMVECLDISAGGAKLHFHGGVADFNQGDLLTVIFNIQKRWSFEVDGFIRHFSTKNENDQIFGMQFHQPKKSLASRLAMMILDLQKANVLMGK